MLCTTYSRIANRPARNLSGMRTHLTQQRIATRSTQLDPGSRCVSGAYARMLSSIKVCLMSPVYRCVLCRCGLIASVLCTTYSRVANRPARNLSGMRTHLTQQRIATRLTQLDPGSRCVSGAYARMLSSIKVCLMSPVYRCVLCRCGLIASVLCTTYSRVVNRSFGK